MFLIFILPQNKSNRNSKKSTVAVLAETESFELRKDRGRFRVLTRTIRGRFSDCNVGLRPVNLQVTMRRGTDSALPAVNEY